VSYKYKKIEVKSGPLAIACYVLISRAKIGFFLFFLKDSIYVFVLAFGGLCFRGIVI